MRTITVLFAFAALLALPGVQALQPIVADAPDASVTLHSATYTVDTSQYVAGAPGVSGQVHTRDETLSVEGAACMVDPNDHEIGVTRAKSVCEPAKVDAPQADPNVIQADVQLLLPSADNTNAAPAPGAHTETATIGSAPVSSTLVLYAAAAAGASALTLYGAWRVLKFTGLAALLPLYSHLSDDEILDDPNRAAIYRLIQEEAGISTKDVADRLGLAWGTVTHHLGKLEKRRFVVSKKYGKYRRYFANGQGGSDQKDVLAVLRVDRTGDVAALIQSRPGMTQKAVSEALGVSSSTILWHVKRLEEVHLVTKVREGKLVRYFPGDALGSFTMIPAANTVTAA